MVPDCLILLSQSFVLLLTWHAVRFQELFWSFSSGLSPFRIDVFPLIGFNRLNTKINAERLIHYYDVRHEYKTPVGNAEIKCNQELKIEGNFLNRSQLERQLVASYCMFRLKSRSITYILAIAGWHLLPKQCPFNMIRTDYGVVYTSKEPGPIITPAFQHDSRASSPLPANIERKGKRAQAACNTPEAQCEWMNSSFIQPFHVLY